MWLILVPFFMPFSSEGRVSHGIIQGRAPHGVVLYLGGYLGDEMRRDEMRQDKTRRDGILTRVGT